MVRLDPIEVGRQHQRCVGTFRGEQRGPTLVCVGGIHGDEPAGLIAVARVLGELERRQPSFRGELVALAGNLPALAKGRRFLDKDFNRNWLDDQLEIQLEALGSGLSSGNGAREDREQRELLQVLNEVFDRARGEVYLLDLHTSSADGEPFVCIGDTLRNRAFADNFPVPVIFGLEECIDGALLEYVNNLGHITMGVEAGNHRAESSVGNHEAFVWLALLATGNLEPGSVPEADEHRRRLRRASGHLPPIMEVRHRHAVRPEDDFEMEPGFRNFQDVEAGQLVAHDRRGEVRAGESGKILLPLYQGLGSDGFFIAREVHEFWLKVSAAVRRLGLDSVLHWLPGVRRHPTRDATLIVDTRVARWFALELFHLLGYRKQRSAGDKLVVSRRKFDHRSPQEG